MAVISIQGQRRDKLGKGGARKARAAGLIPGVLYGHGETPIAVAIGARDFEVALRSHKGANPIVSLGLDGAEYTALVRDAQIDPLTHGVIHLDFQHISLTEKIEVSVAVHLTGMAVGVKDFGGILETITRELDVRCLPTAIPAAIDIDVSALNIGDSIHVRDIQVADVEILTDPDATITTVVPPTVVEEAAPAEAVPAEVAPAEPEVIAKGKKEEEEGEEKEKKEKEKK